MKLVKLTLTQQGNALRPHQQLRQSWWTRVGEVIWQLGLQFGRRTTFHGLNRLLVDHASRWERFMWLATFISAFLGAVYVCLILSQRYRDGNFETVVNSTQYPVYRIPFPVITICNQNQINWHRMDEAKQKFMTNVTDPGKLSLFELIVSTYDSLAFANFGSFGRLRGEDLSQLSHINFSQVVDFMTWRCEEFLANCEWRLNPFSCCELFSKRRSKHGICWSFNSLDTPEGKRMQLLDPMWPWRTGAAGPASALTLRVLIQPEKHWPGSQNEKGIAVMLTEQLVWPDDAFVIPAHTNTVIEIEPVIYFYDNGTRAVSSDQRECVFDDEQNSHDFKSLMGYVYMSENCLSECHQEYLVRYCNCTMDLLFPPGKHVPKSLLIPSTQHYWEIVAVLSIFTGQYRSCRAPDLPCLAEHNDMFRYSHQPGEEQFLNNPYEGMVCKCFRNCYSLNYINDVRPSNVPPAVYGNVSYVDLDVHYRFETMMVYRTSLVFSWLDLIVSFGGIAGLFLGCSLISGMELVYFLCIEVPAFLMQGFRQMWSSKIQLVDVSPQLTTLNRRGGISSQMEEFFMQARVENNHHNKTFNK